MTAAAGAEPLVCSDGWMQGDSQDAQRYDLLGEIATGGMATVYVAKLRGAHGFARTVAVKCMHPQYAKDPSFVDMFLDEARVAAKIRHPNVVPTLDIIQEEEQLLIVLEYVEGETLSAILKSARSKGTKIAPPIACAIVHDLLCGLHAAHEATDDEGKPLDIIHRDVSPQNVIVGVDGLARVLDFGVAKASGRAHETRSGEIKGKVPYMPVEQLYGEDLDRRADVYAAGVVLWEALTGERLFEAPSDAALVLKIAEATIEPPSARLGVTLPPDLDRVVMKALARERGERYATALEFAEELGRAIPPATRLDVAAFVKEHAADTLAERERKLRAWERTPSQRDLAPLARVVATALKEATTRRVSITPTFGGVVTRGRQKQRSRSLVVIGLLLAILGGVIALAAVREKKPEPLRVDYATPASASGGREIPPPAPLDGPSSATPPKASAGASAEPSPPPRPTQPKAPPSPPTAKTTTTAPTTTSLKDTAACRPPYVVDAEGNRHYKMECL